MDNRKRSADESPANPRMLKQLSSNDINTRTPGGTDLVTKPAALPLDLGASLGAASLGASNVSMMSCSMRSNPTTTGELLPRYHEGS